MEQGFMVSDKPTLLARLEEQPSDSLLALIALANADPRPGKIDVGVGVYRDAAGNTPILRSVKAAEKILWETQETKSYLGSQGDARFVELIKPIVFGADAAGDDRIVGVQTPGGCGALRLGAELIVRADRNARIYVGTPTWPNHEPLIGEAGVEMVDYPYYSKESRTICFDRMMGALGEAERGRPPPPPRLLPQSDRRRSRPRPVARRRRSGRGARPHPLCRSRLSGARQRAGGRRRGDAAGRRRGGAGDRRAELRQEFRLLSRPARLAVRQDADREGRRHRDGQSPRAGADHVVDAARSYGGGGADHPRRCRTARGLALGARLDVRAHPAAAGAARRLRSAAFAYIGGQHGMFSMLPLTPDQVLALRRDHGIYMAGSGRFNVVGLSDDNVDRFAAAVVAQLDD